MCLHEGFKKGWRRPTFPLGIAVSSALAGLTSLFGMGRGGPCRNSHPKIFMVIGEWLIVNSIHQLTVYQNQ